MRFGLGPVFLYECLAITRRWQTYALRSAGVAALLGAMGLTAISSQVTTGNSWRDYAVLGQRYFVALIGVELAVVMLIAPAATAGTICLDRARGTLAHMLMTDLSDAEIVLGKLAARLLPVLTLIACTWPVMAIGSLLGGIDPIALSLAFAVILAVAVLGCTLALAVSVWARKSHEVILSTYLVFILGLLIWPTWSFLTAGVMVVPPTWMLLIDPFYVALAPYADPGKLELRDYLIFFGVTLGSSAILTTLAVWRTRPVACRGSVEQSKGPRHGLTGRLTRWLPGPSLDRNPVFWRERLRTRPSRWMMAVLVLIMGTTGVLCIVGAVAFWINGFDRPRGIWQFGGMLASLLHLTFGLLLLAAIAPTSMAEERQRGSLDILAATALSTREIVTGKWLGTFRLVVIMAIGPGLMALAMATASSNARATTAFGTMPPAYYGEASLQARWFGAGVVIATILAHGALITSIGLALAVWIKRQSRAIAFCIGSFILIAAAWPIVVTNAINSRPDLGRSLISLSPVVACGHIEDYVNPQTYWNVVENPLECDTVWAVEVFTLAMGLLWLTVRTIDGCCDRIPDRPHRNSVLSIVIMIVAAMTGAGALVGAADSWIDGVNPSWPSTSSRLGILACSLMTATGLVLIAVESARLGRRRLTTVSVASLDRTTGSLILDRWQKSFRLVLLLAIGPALFAMALAWAHNAPRYQPQFTKNAAGFHVVTSYVLAQDVRDAIELLPGQRLMIAVVLVVTILVHGGAAISIGLALTTASQWSRRTLAAVGGLTVLVVIVLPIYLFLAAEGHILVTAMWNVVMASSSLLSILLTRRTTIAGEVLWSVLFWDVVFSLFAVGLTSGTIWFWQRQLRGASRTELSLAADRAGD